MRKVSFRPPAKLLNPGKSGGIICISDAMNTEIQVLKSGGADLQRPLVCLPLREVPPYLCRGNSVFPAAEKTVSPAAAITVRKTVYRHQESCRSIFR